MIKDALRERSQRDTEPLCSLPRDSGHTVLLSCWWTHQPGSSAEPWCPRLILRSYYKHDWLNNWQQIDSISSSFPGGWAAESSNPLTAYLAFLMTSPDPKATWGLTTSHLISTDTHSTLGFWSSVTGTGDKDQIFSFYYVTLTDTLAAQIQKVT